MHRRLANLCGDDRGFIAIAAYKLTQALRDANGCDGITPISLFRAQKRIITGSHQKAVDGKNAMYKFIHTTPDSATREKSNLRNRFKLIWVVQSAPQK